MRSSQKRSSRLGQVGADAQVFLIIHIKDTQGNPVKNKEFYVERIRAENGSRIPEYKGSETTNENGNLISSFWWDGDPTVSALISITPLFGSEDAPKDKAIVWKIPVTWRAKPEDRTDIVLKPGGGLQSGANVVAPKPPPKPVPTTLPPGSSAPGDSGMSTKEIVGWVALGLGALAFTYFFVLPMVFGKDKK